MEFKFDPNDPAWPAFKELAVKKGWTQDDASSVLDAYAAAEIAKAQKFNTALQSEREKLGANGTNRVTAVQTALKGEVGEELMTAMMAGVWTAKALEGFERLLSARMTQGAANFSQAHRTPEPSAPGRVSDDEYNRMSQAERWEYARSFNQSQFHDPNKMNGR
jgi:hypothetical protein